MDPGRELLHPPRRKILPLLESGAIYYTLPGFRYAPPWAKVYRHSVARIHCKGVIETFIPGCNCDRAAGNCTPPIPRVTLGMKIQKSVRINDALIQIEELEEREPENRYIVVWRDKEEENRYSARSLEDAEEYFQYRCRLAEQRRI